MEILGKDVLGQGNSKSKGPEMRHEARMCLAFLKKSKRARVDCLDNSISEGELLWRRAEAQGQARLQHCCPFSRLLPQLGSPPLGDIDGCLS